MRTYYCLAGIAITTTVFLNACGGEEVALECNYLDKSRNPVTVKVKASKISCDEVRTLAQQDKPLPADAVVSSSIATPTPSTPAPSVKAPRAKSNATTANSAKQPPFTTAFVQARGNSSLIATTDTNKLREKLDREVAAKANPKRDPFAPIPGSFTIPVIGKPISKTISPPPSKVRVSKPEPKPLPEPTEAKAINVSGVMAMGDTQFAIVSVPNEASSRYVTVGQRLAGNQVLVKRIDTSGIPTVILEQFGIEVPRPVAASGPVAAVPTANTAPASAPAPSTAPNSVPTTLTPGVILPPAPSANTPAIVAPAGIPVPGLPQVTNNMPK